MKHLLIIYRQSNRPKAVLEELEGEGYGVYSMGIETLDFNQLKLSGIDIVIIYLYPDIATSWGTYLSFKKRYPDFPVLLYMHQSNVENLKTAVKDVLRKRAGVFRKFLPKGTLPPHFRTGRLRPAHSRLH
mgnify:FL=1